MNNAVQNQSSRISITFGRDLWEEAPKYASVHCNDNNLKQSSLIAGRRGWAEWGNTEPWSWQRHCWAESRTGGVWWNVWVGKQSDKPPHPPPPTSPHLGCVSASAWQRCQRLGQNCNSSQRGSDLFEVQNCLHVWWYTTFTLIIAGNDTLRLLFCPMILQQIAMFISAKPMLKWSTLTWACWNCNISMLKFHSSFLPVSNRQQADP